MPRTYSEIAILAAKNIFAQGSNYFRAYRAILIFGFPFLIGDLASDYAFTVLVYLGFPVSMSDLIYEYLFPLLILLFVFWLWQLLFCVGFKNDDRLKMNDEEEIFTKISLFLFACYFIFVNGYFNLQSSGFGAVFQTMFGMISFGITILGIFLTIKARDRIPVLLDMMLTTSCVAVTFIYMSQGFFYLISEVIG